MPRQKFGDFELKLVKQCKKWNMKRMIEAIKKFWNKEMSLKKSTKPVQSAHYYAEEICLVWLAS